jgi:hypothetical protein
MTPGKATKTERRNKTPMMTKAKIHWKAMTWVRNWETPRAGEDVREVWKVDQGVTYMRRER